MQDIAQKLLNAAWTGEMHVALAAASMLDQEMIPVLEVVKEPYCINLYLHEGCSPRPQPRIQVDLPSHTVAVPDGAGKIQDYQTVERLAEALRAIRLPVLTMLIGLPGAGKSTWCNLHRAPVVSPDAFRIGMGVDPHSMQTLDRAIEGRVWEMTRHTVAALFRTGTPEVILDATSAQMARRAIWLPGPEQAPELAGVKYRVRAVFIDTPVDICLQRRPNIQHVVERMARQLEVPTLSEDFFEILRIDGALPPRSPYLG